MRKAQTKPTEKSNPMKRHVNMIVAALMAASVAPAWAQTAPSADSAPPMDHSKIPGMSDKPMPGMDHGAMEMAPMQGGSAPADARDPNAYSDGYDYGTIPAPRLGDTHPFGSVLIDRFERGFKRNRNTTEYDLQAWYGLDYDRAVLKAEGTHSRGKLQEARTELLWGHAIATYWDTQLGVRYDSGVGPERGWLAFGVQGLAPYWFDVEATGYIGNEGRSALRLAASYDVLLTQKLILQPRVDAEYYSKRDSARELGSGMSNLTAGIRLRYEIKREFAPYVGLEWGKKYGETASFARAAGEPTGDTRLVFGVRFWF